MSPVMRYVGLTKKSPSTMTANKARLGIQQWPAAFVRGISNNYANQPRRKLLNLDTIQPLLKEVQYAVRGELAIRAEQLRDELADPAKRAGIPFTKITNCNIGNPQQLEQRPITFFRQVLALMDYPDLILDPKNLPITSKLFPEDAISRAKQYLAGMGGSTGAYSHSKGIPIIRRHVADFIHQRDGGEKPNPEHIFLTAGASPGVQLVLQSLIQHPHVGIMIPVPQYPLYTASISLFNGMAVPYNLDESDNWSMSVSELERSYKEASRLSIDTRALCVINPGNPTGQCMAEDNMKQVIEFCHDTGLVLLADEVYQTNVYSDSLPFNSFKKVLKSMGAKYKDFELISFHSVSKGMVGECGRRGGYFECTGIDEKVLDIFYKIASISLCPPVSGQAMVGLMANPPKKGDPSYNLYQLELNAIYDSLKRRALKLAAAFNRLEGVTCNAANGSMYLFPQIRLPPKAIEFAESQGKCVDEIYAMELLNATGVCVIPGSGFLQVEGTYHFRCTFLPPENEIDQFIAKIEKFHDTFLKKFT